MEDFYETSVSEVDGQMVAFFGVFDGMPLLLTHYVVFPLFFKSYISWFQLHCFFFNKLWRKRISSKNWGRVYMWFMIDFLSFFLSNIGHGGSRTAEYLKNNLFKNLCAHPNFIKDTKTAIGMKLVKFLLYYMLGNSIICLYMHVETYKYIFL